MPGPRPTSDSISRPSQLDATTASRDARRTSSAARHDVCQDAFGSAEEVSSVAPPAERMRFIELAGMKLTGVDINDVERGVLTIDVPLNPGTHEMPKDNPAHAHPQLAVNDNSNLSVTVLFGKDEAGKAVIERCVGEFSPSVRILNPASAFDPTGVMLIGGYADSLKDYFADLVIDKFTITSKGDVELTGVVSKLIGADDDLQKHIPPSKLPKVKTLLEGYLPKGVVPSDKEKALPETGGDSGEIPEPAKPKKDLSDLLKRFGALVGDAKYSLDLETAPRTVGLTGEAVQIKTKEGITAVLLSGHVELLRSGSIDFGLEKTSVPGSGAGGAKKPTFKTPLFSSNLEIREGHITRPKRGQVVTAEVDLETTLGHIDGQATVKGKAMLPVDFEGEENTITVRNAMLRRGSKGFEVTGSEVYANVEARVAEDEDVAKAFGAELHFEEGRVGAQARGKVSYRAGRIGIEGGRAAATLSALHPQLKYAGFGAEAKGELGARLAVREVEYDEADKYPSLEGDARVTLIPSDEMKKLFPKLDALERKVNFTVAHDGGFAATLEDSETFTKALSSVINLRGNPDAMWDLSTEAVGPHGSEAFQKHMNKVLVNPSNSTKAADREVKIRPNNQVQRLEDGIQSFPKRIEMIETAEKGDILFAQTLIFKPDDTGMQLARAYAAALERGVEVHIIVDSLGNMEKFEDLLEENPVYTVLKAARGPGGERVNLHLYNDAAETGLRDIVEILRDNKDLIINFKSIRDIEDPRKAIEALRKLSMAAQGLYGDLKDDTREKLADALGAILGAKGKKEVENSVAELGEFSKDGVVDLTEFMVTLRQVAELNNRWHEKYCGKISRKDRTVENISGGMNLADEYLKGGIPGARATCMDVERPAWRDADIYVKGPAALDLAENFSDNLEYITGHRLEHNLTHEELEIEKSEGGGVDVRVIQHRPLVDGDHNITNYFIESLKALGEGDPAYFVLPYFLPTDALESFKEALMDAARRGVDVRIQTNSKTTTDCPQINKAAILQYRELLAAGVRIFERTGERALHQKRFVLGAVAGPMSWNGDNRSCALNAELLVEVLNETYAERDRKIFLSDTKTEDDAEGKAVCVEVKLEDIATQSLKAELETLACSTVSSLA